MQREGDSTCALIPDSVHVPMVAGHMKPDPLDAPRRKQGREERKEIFRREVEITKKVLKRVNIDVSTFNLFFEKIFYSVFTCILIMNKNRYL